MIRCAAFAASLLIALTTAAGAAPQAPSPADHAARLFADKGLSGAIAIQDIRTGALIVSIPADAPTFLPLSVTKLFLAASFYEHEAEPHEIADVSAIVRRSLDDPGRKVALDLRHTLGDKVMLADLARFGFPQCQTKTATDCTELSPQTSDPDWADAMSIGEAHFRVTLPGLARFLTLIANDGVGADKTRAMRATTAKALQSVMFETVQDGTARSIRNRMGKAGTIGGKTGSGPAGAKPFDGVFAALAYDPSGAPRYAIVTYVKRGGLGGGAAADISAAMALFLLHGEQQAPQ